MWRDDEELFGLVRARLFPAVVGDVMDALGFQHQFLPPEIQPLREDMVLLGRAMPVVEQDIPEGSESAVGVQAFGLMFRALDDLRAGEVYVASGGSLPYALWGELMSTRAMQLQAAGAVLDGYSRDTRGIVALGFPTFSRGRYAQDQKPRGRVTDFRVGVTIGGVRVEPGDLLFGDLDGVPAVPRAAEAEILRLALEKVAAENLVRVAMTRDGLSATGAFAKFGVM